MRIRALEPFAGAWAKRTEGERCEFCGLAVEEGHRHVLDLDRGAVCCTCRACALLFTNREASRGRYRGVPDRVLVDPNLYLSDDEWAALDIPVGLVFVSFASRSGKWRAFYPSPAGAVESELGLEAWSDVVARSELLSALEPDVEAILVHRPRGELETKVLLVPIDVCYSLVGVVRRRWKGLGGGEEVWRELETTLRELWRGATVLARPEARA